jgi:hypothetical protein
MRIRRPKSMETVDDLSLIVIHFYVAVLMGRLNYSKISQLSENITPFTICHLCTNVTKKELRYTPGVRGVGDSVEHCDTPDCISLGVGISPSTEILIFL